jgi:hypothetical protein
MKLLLAALLTSGCSAIWPTVVRPSPDDPLFHSGFPLEGPARLDAALCSLATVGPDATSLVTPPASMAGAVDLGFACDLPAPAFTTGHGRQGQLVHLPGDIYGYLYRVEGSTGIAVAFAGLGMPSGGWINEKFAELAAARGLTLFALIRTEPRPIFFDPLLEARRGIEAAALIEARCSISTGDQLRFLGVSLGGMEALLANREALKLRKHAKVAVLDPLMDPLLATDNLDSFWHSVSVDSMQKYFRRILAGRYGEDPPPSFKEVLNRTGAGAATKLSLDAPNAWLCKEPRPAYAIFVSDTDPVLGDEQRKFAYDCKFPLLPAHVPGHVPLACRMEIFDEMWSTLGP